MNKGIPGLLKSLVLAYRLRSVIILVSLVAAGFSEAMGVATMLPLLALSGEGGSGENTALGRFVEYGLHTVGLSPTLPTLLALIVLAMSVKAGLYVLAMSQVGYASARVSADLRLAVIRSLLGARWEYLVNQSSGSLTNTITSEVLRASTAYSRSCMMIAQIAQVVAYSVIALFISWKVTVAALSVGCLMMVSLRGLVKMTAGAGERLTSLLRSVSARLMDALQGIKPIKAMACEDLFGPLLELETSELKTADQKLVVSAHGLTALQQPIMVVALAAGVYLVVTSWGTPLELLLVLGLLFWRSVDHVATFQRLYQEIKGYESAFWSINSVINDAEAAAEVSAGGAAPVFVREITYRNISFSYGDKNLFENVSLSVPSGRFTVLTGPSGAGKTTLLDLAIGLVRPQSGDVWIDDTRLRDLDLRAWRRMTGYVPQETFLFHESIYSNITLGAPAFTKSDAKHALEEAGAWRFVKDLPEGMDTVVGERGSKLSGGQRQRIAIARALVRKPKLLILDEVTSALDPKTEAAICATLKELLEKVTILAISHQPALVEAADVVYHLTGGQVASRSPEASQVRGLAG